MSEICGNAHTDLWDERLVICQIPKGEPHENHGGYGRTWPNYNYTKELEIYKASLVKCQNSYVMFLTEDLKFNRYARYTIRKEIVDTLNASGRTKETITWIEGWYEFGEEFPLDPKFGKTEHWRIVGYCYLPKF